MALFWKRAPVIASVAAELRCAAAGDGDGLEEGAGFARVDNRVKHEGMCKKRSCEERYLGERETRGLVEGGKEAEAPKPFMTAWQGKR